MSNTTTTTTIDQAEVERPTLWQLFSGFSKVGVVAIGGALPHVQRLVLERHKWMTTEEFRSIVGICQFVPGPNATNITLCVGNKLRGPMGVLTLVEN